MICAACESAKVRPYVGGSYNLACLPCCVRLVLSAYPDKRQASVMLAAIGRFEGGPDRDVVLSEVRAAIAQRAESQTSTAPNSCSLPPSNDQN